jgi:putative transposase
MTAVTELSSVTGTAVACRHLALSRSTYYHRRKPRITAPRLIVRPSPPRTLTADERQMILDFAHSDRFINASPAEIVYVLIDEGLYVASERSFYRVLAANREVRERRNLARHPHYAAPELLATAPNQVYTWDITNLKTMTRGVVYKLYDITDMFSRYHPGWMVAERESEALAVELIEQTCARQGIAKHTLTIHADRGSSMRSGSVAELFSRLEITKSHSRPYCSNDNPYSESAFKTLKYRPEFPERFGPIQEAREICGNLFQWVNFVHRHSGIAMLTPAMVHFGQAQQVINNRDKVLLRYFEQHPGRFLGGKPAAKRLPDAVYINKPKTNTMAESKLIVI